MFRAGCSRSRRLRDPMLTDLLTSFVDIDRDVAVFVGVVITALIVALGNARAGLVVLVIATLVFRAPMAAAVPKVIDAVPAFLADAGRGSASTTADVDAVLATIRTMESGGDYRAVSPDGSATGAYQFQDATWAEQGGAGRAMDAAPEEQDRRARSYVEAILAKHGDVPAVPVQWFWPIALTDPLQMDFAPYPELHNGMTVRQYQEKWLEQYDRERAELVSIGQGGHKLSRSAAAGFAAWQDAYGSTIPITDSFRSWDHQAKRHAEEPGRFVAPEDSAHVTGEAVDVNLYEVDVPRLLAAAQATGWCQSALNNNEPWHFSFNGCK